jgi:ankyrin repeat protein
MIVDFDIHLIMGAYDKDLEKVKVAIEGGADVNTTGVWGKTALIMVCGHDGSFEIAKYLVDHGADVSKGGENTEDTPLAYASMYGHLEIVKILIDAGADVNLKGEYGRTPLHYASSPTGSSTKNNYEIVKLLLENGADPNALNEAEENPLQDSIWYEGFDIEIAKLLIDAGIDLETKGSFNSTALTRAIDAKRLDLVKLFKEKADVLLVKQNDLNSALVEAFREKDNKELIFYLLEQGADMRYKERFGTNVLSYAAEHGFIDMIEYLIDHGLDLTEDIDDTNNALREAAYTGQFEVIKFLVDHGADINGGDYGASENPLMKAARHDYVEIAEYLIDNGADLEVRDDNGNTPLLFAAYEGSYKVAKLLLEKGADIQAKNEMNWNALMQAASEGYTDVAKLLLEAGSEVNVRGNEKGETPLILASWKNAPEIVKLLLEYKADKTMKDTNGDTALDYAKNERYLDVIALLK